MDSQIAGTPILARAGPFWSRPRTLFGDLIKDIVSVAACHKGLGLGPTLGALLAVGEERIGAALGDLTINGHLLNPVQAG